jgi:hypothetical protein
MLTAAQEKAAKKLVARKQAAVRLRPDRSLEVRTSSLRGRFEYVVAPSGAVTRIPAPSLPKIHRLGYLMEIGGLYMFGVGLALGLSLKLLDVTGVIQDPGLAWWLFGLACVGGLPVFVVGLFLSRGDPFLDLPRRQ